MKKPLTPVTNEFERPAVPLVTAVTGLLRRVVGSNDETGGAQDQLDLALQDLGPDQKNMALKAYERAYPKCESPIERRLLPWLICQPYSFFPHTPLVLLEGESAQLPDRHIALVPQIRMGRFRVDFALAARRGGPVRFVVVECDGAAFHEDVHKDVERDAALLASDRVLDVCFLSGKEIMSDPRAAAIAAARACAHAWPVTNQQTAAKFKRPGGEL